MTTDLGSVDLYEQGQRIEIPPEVLEEWRFVGLSNKCFVETRFWEAK